MTNISSALQSVGLTPEQIASRSKLAVERVRILFLGGSAKLSEVRALSTGLRLPLRYFSPNTAERSRSTARMQFRSTRISSTDYNPTAERVIEFVDAALTILPQRTQPPTILSLIKYEPSIRHAKLLASQFRDGLGLDDASPLVDLFPRAGRLDGVIVSLLKDSRFEGVSLTSGNYLFIFISPRFKARMLFTLAHEIGHCLAGQVTEGEALIEGASEIGNYKKSGRNERFVDLIAGSILLPDEGILRFLGYVRSQYEIDSASPLGDVEILLLARFFGVSFDVAGRRCEDLALLPKGGAISLADELRKRHGSPEKRAVELGLPARVDPNFQFTSHWLADAIINALHDGSISAGWAADRLGISISEMVATHQVRRSK